MTKPTARRTLEEVRRARVGRPCAADAPGGGLRPPFPSLGDRFHRPSDPHQVRHPPRLRARHARAGRVLRGRESRPPRIRGAGRGLCARRRGRRRLPARCETSGQRGRPARHRRGAGSEGERGQGCSRAHGRARLDPPPPSRRQMSLAMPDLHSGYGFAIGNVAAFDTADPAAVVSPGGVGFDINCGVRLLRTNLTEADVAPVKEQLAQALFDHIPVGVGSQARGEGGACSFEEMFETGSIDTYHQLHRLCPFLPPPSGHHPNHHGRPGSRPRARHGLVPAGRVRVAGGQGALRGGGAHARGRPGEGVGAGQEAGAAPDGDTGGRESLCRGGRVGGRCGAGWRRVEARDPPRPHLWSLLASPPRSRSSTKCSTPRPPAAWASTAWARSWS